MEFNFRVIRKLKLSFELAFSDWVGFLKKWKISKVKKGDERSEDSYISLDFFSRKFEANSIIEQQFLKIQIKFRN